MCPTQPRAAGRRCTCVRSTAPRRRKFALPNPNTLGPLPEVDDGRPKAKDFQVKNT
jgi:hypothetical protein